MVNLASSCATNPRVNREIDRHGAVRPAEADRRALNWRMLATLLVAQLLVAIAARLALWPPDGLAGFRTALKFTHWDVLAIGAIGLVGAAALLATERWTVARRMTITLVALVAMIHCLLMAANVTAVHWLRVPMTWQWLYFSDLGRTQTPLAIAGSVLTPAAIAGALAAIALPSLLWLGVRRAVHPRSTVVERAIAIGLAGLLLAVPLLRADQAPVRDRWRDAVSSPGIAMARSLWTDGSARLLQRAGDGRVQDYAALPARTGLSVPESQRPDIVLVVLESVSRDHVFGNLSDLPTLATLAADGTVYPNAGVANANSVRSIFELYFSRFPVLGYQPETYLYDRVDTQTVPAVLERSGYRSATFLASDFGYQDAGAFLERHGAGELHDIDTIECDDRIALSSERWQSNDYLPDACVFSAASHWLAAFPEQPSFVTIWTGPTHFPYTPPQSPGDAAVPSDPAARHLLALRETDARLGNFLDEARRSGRDPIVLVTSDHGEAFGLHGTNVHGYTVFEDETAIPFILSGPDLPAGRSDPRLVALADVAPTLAELAGAGRPAGWQGLSVLGTRQRERAFRFAMLDVPMIAMMERGRKTVLDLRRDKMVSFDLSVDPDEQQPRPVAGERREAVAAAMAGWARYNRALNEAPSE